MSAYKFVPEGEPVGSPVSRPARGANQVVRPRRVIRRSSRHLAEFSYRRVVEDVALLVALVLGFMVCAHFGLERSGW